MLDRIKGWSAYLAGTVETDGEELIGFYTRTGRPLGSKDFLRKLEVIAVKELVPKRPDRKPIIGK